MHVAQLCSVIVRLPAIVALWCIVGLYTAGQCIWRACGGGASALAAGSGQRTAELRNVGLILADAGASANVLHEFVAQAAAVLAANGCQRVTVHDAHSTLQREREALLAALRAANIEGSYSTPRSVLQDWSRVWDGGARAAAGDRPRGVRGGAGGTADRDFLQAQLQAALGASAAAAPDLLLVAGPVLSLAGFAPWHARFCEILHLGAARGAGARVQGALQRYTSTLQRGGT